MKFSLVCNLVTMCLLSMMLGIDSYQQIRQHQDHSLGILIECVLLLFCFVGALAQDRK